jgi:putative Holliday junction resolvase
MRVLALDLGEKRIGLAISDEEGSFAFPAGVLERKDRRQDLAALAELMAERGVGRAVVGLPLHMDGRSGPEAEAARRFAHDLAGAAGVPVETLDERWTSREAERALRDAGASRKRRHRKGAVDEIAATIILRTYLDRGAGPASGD